MKPAMHVVLAPMQLKPGVAEAQLLEASDAFQQNFVTKQQGVLRRTLLKDSHGGYADLVFFENDEAFRKQLEEGYGFHKEIGTKRMIKTRCDVTSIDATHHLAKVFYHADYEKDGKRVGLDFEVTYLLDSGKGEPKIFAFIAGDEMAAYRQAGLID